MRGILFFAAICASPTMALAQSHDAIVENCRQTVGRPIVQGCMAGKRNDGTALEACRAQASPKVRACVMATEQKIAAGKAAPAAPKDDKPSIAASAIAAIKAIFVAPPRNISDITAILDQEKPDPAKIEKANSDAAVEPNASLKGEKLVQFYYDRSNARQLLGRNEEALADGLKALEMGQKGGSPNRQMNRVRQGLAQKYLSLGDPKKAVEVLSVTVANAEQPGSRGALINASRIIAQTYVAVGDIDRADSFAKRVVSRVQEARGSPHPNWRQAYLQYGNSWEADSEEARALVFEARGQYKEAEDSYRKAEAFRRASIKDIPKYDYAVPVSQVEISANHSARAIARVKARQGRLAEAESESRRALLATLKSVGKYNTSTPFFISGLASILVDQGRYAEAEKLARSSVEIRATLGIAEDSQYSVGALSQLASILTLQRKDEEAAAIYAKIETAVAKWEPQRREAVLVNGSRISALYAAGRVEDGITVARSMVASVSNRKGADGYDAAAARGMLAIGYALARRDDEAVKEFKAALPTMMAAARENADDEDTSVVANRSRMLQTITESYMRVLARSTGGRDAVALETFALADAIRGRSVQQALAASSARMTVKDPALAELVRGEQDLTKQVNAQLGTLNNTLALPPSDRDEQGVRTLMAAIAKLRADRDKARADINKRFPAYADLVDPKPPTVEQIKAALKPGESLLSFYFGQRSSFVWAVPKEGAVAFAAIPATALDLEGKVRHLRDALEPQAAMISDIPPFDLKLAHEIYSLLLKPVEAGWKSSKNLVVVTNGALGLLPLSLLPTEPAHLKEHGPTFAGYRDVPWLARTHAVTMVPSAAALRTLRALPPGQKNRSELIAFGDPYFSEEQAAEAEKKVVMASADGNANVSRGAPLHRRSSPKTQGINSADLAQLPRLPDTADELRSIAAALQADPAKTLHLGKDANEKNVKSIDLSNAKVVAFATHGLVPGELDGLTQPALALSAPQVADADGDGLLTMEEILALKLDADWVVLSACNTGAGAGAGAEAASGLGRAFFYAGTRAILVTNWSVHSQSARELVTDLFRRQAQSAGVGRGEALRQAMLALIDGKGFTNDKGDTLFAYAHPLFWAPYTIIGDGG
jgi:CHAT domain-containing protein